MGVIQKLLRLLHMIRERGAGEEEQLSRPKLELKTKAGLFEERTG